MDYKTASLEEIREAVLEDGVIDTEEAMALRERVYLDGKVDQEEADFLFELNDAVSGKDNCSEWTDLFVDALTAFVLEDDETPGVIDESEAIYLISKIFADGTVDSNEIALLTNLKDKAASIHPTLQFKMDLYV